MSKTFNYNTTKIKNPSTGEWENMNSVTLKGKSAYEYAVEGGYEGTEEEFTEKLAKEYVGQDDFQTLQSSVGALNSKLIPKKIIDNIIPSDGQTIGFSSDAKMLMIEVGNPSVNASILVPNIITTKPYIVTAVWDAGSNTYTRLTFKIVDGGLKVDTIYGSGNWATVAKYVSVYEVG